jgi:nitrogen fixation/metabolism regulation signal transduction histidine kinase
MKQWKPYKRGKILLISIIFIFLVYFSAIIYFSFTIETPTLYNVMNRNKFLLPAIFFSMVIMFLFILYNIVQIAVDSVKKKEGARFRMRLTFFFLITASIPLMPLSIVSNNWISKSVNLLFIAGIDSALNDALEISKKLYGKLSDEVIREWDASCKDCSPGGIKDIEFQDIDAVFSVDFSAKEIDSLFLKHTGMDADFESLIVSDTIDDTWKKVSFEDSEYLLIPVSEGLSSEDIGNDITNNPRTIVLVKKISGDINKYTQSITNGLQNYRSLIFMRKTIKVFVVTLFIIVTLPFVLLSFYLSLIISKDVTVPIRELVIATQKVSDDDLDYRIQLDAKDELSLLIDSFNNMTEELRLNKELLKYSERSAAWQDIAMKIAHEIKNPLTPIKLSAERILRLYEGDDKFREILSKGIDTIITEVNNITSMVNEFSRFTRFPDSKLEKYDIITLVDEIFYFVQNAYKNVEFSINHNETEMYLFIDRYQVRRAILNIIYNSVDALSENGRIDISCYPSEERKGFYTISLKDNGSGIDDKIKGKVFNPYFTTKGKGAGLGLAIVEKIVFDNKGRIWFESFPGNTTFYLEFSKT